MILYIFSLILLTITLTAPVTLDSHFNHQHIMFPTSTPISDMDYSVQCLSNLPGLSIGSYNIRSLLPKIDDVACLLHKSDLDILCLNETFLTPVTGNNLIDINGYSLIRNDRSDDVSKNGGGGA